MLIRCTDSPKQVCQIWAQGVSHWPKMGQILDLYWNLIWKFQDFSHLGRIWLTLGRNLTSLTPFFTLIFFLPFIRFLQKKSIQAVSMASIKPPMRMWKMPDTLLNVRALVLLSCSNTQGAGGLIDIVAIELNKLWINREINGHISQYNQKGFTVSI